jgi:poly(3-hydroxyalkanoate) synthetase
MNKDQAIDLQHWHLDNPRIASAEIRHLLRWYWVYITFTGGGYLIQFRPVYLSLIQ